MHFRGKFGKKGPWRELPKGSKIAYQKFDNYLSINLAFDWLKIQQDLCKLCEEKEFLKSMASIILAKGSCSVKSVELV